MWDYDNICQIKSFLPNPTHHQHQSINHGGLIVDLLEAKYEISFVKAQMRKFALSHN